MAETKALVLLAEGAEEMETVITVDVLRRGRINVTVAGLAGCDAVICSRNVRILPDKSLQEALKSAPYDVVVCPGGAKGTQNLAQSEEVKSLLQEQEANNRCIAAVCAGPIALLNHGIAKGKTLTSHPSVKDKLIESGYYKYSEDRVMEDGNLITIGDQAHALNLLWRSYKN